MAGENDGIQQLLAAEKEAAKKVNEARKRKLYIFYFNFKILVEKAMKLRNAKIEAQREIEIEKAQMEREFKGKQEKVKFLLFENVIYCVQILGSKTNYEQKINENTDHQMVQIRDMVTKHKDDAIHRLLDMVLNITPEVHTNFRKK